MIKRIGVLLLTAFVFSGAWWDKEPQKAEPPAPAAVQPAEVEPSEEVPALEELIPDAVSEVPAAVVKQAEPQNIEASNPANANNALKMLTDGEPEVRKARLESLVRLSDALRKQREIQEDRP